MKELNGIQDVLENRLCVGCGGCAFVSGGAVEMHHLFTEGWRPRWEGDLAPDVAKRCADACPVLDFASPALDRDEDELSRACRAAGLGPVRKLWEVHAADEEIRFQGASGGALSALGVHGLDDGCGGVLHIAQAQDAPFRNETVLSRTRAELLSRTGSRYSPTKLCDDLGLMDEADGPCVVVGQPSEIAGLAGVRAVTPELEDKIAVTLSFFCAGAPAMKGTWELIKSKGVDPTTVRDVRYRGRGWPGHFSILVEGNDDPVIQMTYADSWAFAQSFRAWGVHMWPDGAGEAADISCGDPWYREVKPGEMGSSLVMARTERGERFVERAIAAGALVAEPITWEQVQTSQKNLLAKKAELPGRFKAMRLVGLPSPNYANYQLDELWANLPLKERMRIVLGTVRRLIQRGYRQPASLEVPDKRDDPTRPRATAG